MNKNKKFDCKPPISPNNLCNSTTDYVTLKNGEIRHKCKDDADFSKKCVDENHK